MWKRQEFELKFTEESEQSNVESMALAGVAQLVRVSSHKPKGHRFDSQSGHIPSLQVPSLVRTHTRRKRSMFLSHINVPLPPSLSPSLTLSPKSIIMSSGED